jgi:predicted HTH transcriptional regulator
VAGRRDNVDRYDDRLNIRVNLIDAYDLLMDFVEKRLPDPFEVLYADGPRRGIGIRRAERE